MSYCLELVISGGQTGVDQVGLKVAKDLGYLTGGYAPAGWRTDEGPAPWLGTDYHLTETTQSDYGARTRLNAGMADLTVWFGNPYSPGGRCTRRACNLQTWLANPNAHELRKVLEAREIVILNVAGNRLRTNPQASVIAEIELRAALAR